MQKYFLSLYGTGCYLYFMAKIATLTPNSSLAFMVNIRYFGWKNHSVSPRKKSFPLFSKSEVGWRLRSPFQLHVCFPCSQLTLRIASLSAPKSFQNPAEVWNGVTLLGNEAHPMATASTYQVQKDRYWTEPPLHLTDCPLGFESAKKGSLNRSWRILSTSY